MKAADILAKDPASWTPDEWNFVKKAIQEGLLAVVFPSAINHKITLQGDLDEKFGRKTIDDLFPGFRVLPDGTRTSTYTPCAIEEYFKRHPGASSVMMVCTCPKCTVRC